VSTTLGATYKPVVTGLSVRIPNCDGTECELELKKSGDFSGGEAEAQSEGNTARAGASGASAIVRDQGAALPDGTILSPGSNANSGQYVGELMAAGSVGSCAEDIKASIKNGTPVFTCDGNKEVDTLTGSGNECKDIETCTSTEEEELLSSKTCTVSLNYQNAQCDIRYVTKTCDVSNVTETESCTISKVASHIQTVDIFPKCVSASVSSNSSPVYLNIPSEWRNETVDYEYMPCFEGSWTCGGYNGINITTGSLTNTSHQYRVSIGTTSRGQPVAYVHQYPFRSSDKLPMQVIFSGSVSKARFNFCLANTSDFDSYGTSTSPKLVDKSPYLDVGTYSIKVKNEYSDQGYRFYLDLPYGSDTGKGYVYTVADGVEQCEVL
jgi:hypothetical protein